MRRRGFTLLETMVALVILSMIAALVLESYRAGLGIWERQHRGQDARDSARAVMGHLRSEIRSSVPWFQRKEGKPVVYFRGEHHALDFTSLEGLSAQRPEGVMRALRYELEDDPEGEDRRLRVEEHAWPRRDYPGDDEPLVREWVRGVREFSLRYKVISKQAAAVSGKGKGGKGAGVPAAGTTTEVRWEDSWSWTPEKGTETIAAIEVSLSLSDGAGNAETMTEEIPFLGEWKVPYP